jgi:hypothetical protein
MDLNVKLHGLKYNLEKFGGVFVKIPRPWVEKPVENWRSWFGPVFAKSVGESDFFFNFDFF